MHTILGDLREGDHFNIITFSDKVQTWKRGRTVRATRQNVRDAKDFVRSISAEGCEFNEHCQIRLIHSHIIPFHVFNPYLKPVLRVALHLLSNRDEYQCGPAFSCPAHQPFILFFQTPHTQSCSAGRFPDRWRGNHWSNGW